jgi:PAS domain S-box-containing protein
MLIRSRHTEPVPARPRPGHHAPPPAGPADDALARAGTPEDVAELTVVTLARRLRTRRAALLAASPDGLRTLAAAGPPAGSAGERSLAEDAVARGRLTERRGPGAVRMAVPLDHDGPRGALVCTLDPGRVPSDADRAELATLAVTAARALARTHRAAPPPDPDDATRFRLVAGALSDALWRADPHGGLLWMSEGWTGLTGQPAGRALGQGWLERVHHEDRGRVAAAWGAAVTGGGPFEAAHRLTVPGGGVRHVRTHAVALRDAAGRPAEWVGAVRDVTAGVRRGERAEALAHAAVAMARALTPSEVAEAVLGEGLAALGAVAGVLAVRDDDDPAALRVLGARGMPRGGGATAAPVPVASRSLLGEAVRTGRAVTVHGRRELRERFPDLAGAASPRERAWVAVPVTRGTAVLGAVVAGFADPSEASPDDVRAVARLGEWCGQALERARRSGVEHDAARRLQEVMLPGLPAVEGVAADARYLSSDRHLAVGGDWYDVLPLDGGRLMAVVGDVVGRGLRAASVMGQLRSAMRAVALGDPAAGPAGMLAGLDRFAAHIPDATMTTAVCAVLDVRTGALRYATAGHPPVLLVRRGSRRAEYRHDGHSAPLGLTPPGHRTEGAAALAPGDMLVLYTDGLVERRRRPLDDGLALLRDVAARSARGGPGRLCDAVLQTMLDGGRRDDTALLCLAPELITRR